MLKNLNMEASREIVADASDGMLFQRRTVNRSYFEQFLSFFHIPEKPRR